MPNKTSLTFHGQGSVEAVNRSLESIRLALECSSSELLAPFVASDASASFPSDSLEVELQASFRGGAGQGKLSPLGVLRVRGPIGKVSFTREDERLLGALAAALTSELENLRLTESLRQGYRDTVNALTEAVEKKDRCTAGHAKRVAHYANKIARELQLPQGPLSQVALERLDIASRLHDVGKIGIEDRILKKASQLDEDERQIMKTHPQLGFQILHRIQGMHEGFGEVIDGMLYHHERWDGAGYPNGLIGERIPLIARIVAVADAYDAMVASRPYRKGIDPGLAQAEILDGSGTQFCPDVVSAFARAFCLASL